MAHFNHPREMTDVAIRAMDILRKAGTVTVNQTPLIKGINDDPAVLAEISRGLGKAMPGTNIDEIPQGERLQERGW